MIEEVAQHHNPGGFSIETTASFAQDPDYWKTMPPDILVINLPDDDLLQGYYFTKIRKDLQKTQSMIFLCSNISAPLMQMSTMFSKVRMIKTPVGSFSLYRALVDLVQEYQPGQRQIHPRYLTDHPIEIQSDHFVGKMKAKMKNLSLGGAYFESAEKSFEMNTGDYIKLAIFIGQPQKQYVFDVKIVWRKPQQTGDTGYGVSFVDKEEVYNQLLKNM